jgi:hypothetical protein
MMIERRKLHYVTPILCTTLLLFVMGETSANAGAWDWATGPSIQDEEGQRDWGIEVVPYLWIASLVGTAGLPPVGTIPVSATFSDISDNLDAAFAGFMDARYRRRLCVLSIRLNRNR